MTGRHISDTRTMRWEIYYVHPQSAWPDAICRYATPGIAYLQIALDLGVLFDEKLSFTEHIQTEINKAYMMLGIIKRNFRHLTVPTFVLLYTSMVRSHLDYCYSVWTPYKKGDIEVLEKVQKKATKILTALKRLPYSERLKAYRYQPYTIDV